MASPLEIARQYYDLGLYVLPAGFKGKKPLVSWKEHQGGYTPEKLEELFKLERCNYWLICGNASRIVVIDCDGEPARQYWTKILGPLLDITTTCKTASGWHYYFRLPEGSDLPSWSVHQGGVDYDIRANGSGVILPPSIHQSGHQYRWIRDLSFLQDIPEELRPPAAEREQEETAGRSQLSELLTNLPETGGRNEWLSKVCGHYAKQCQFRDAFDAQVALANNAMAEPLDPEEVKKTADSIWETEHRKTPSASYCEENGYLRGTGTRLMTEALIKQGRRTEYIECQWADFDVRCSGVVMDEAGTKSYDLWIHREGQAPVRGLLKASTFGNYGALMTWLAARGAIILPPRTDAYSGASHSRLHRYIDSQNPPQHKAAEYLGWHDGIGFVTHEGVITESGLRAHEEIVPHPKLRNWAPYKYGFSDPKSAREVLREVLTFHHEEPVAVFASWWAACFIKPQIEHQTALFPFMVLEAPSETGKTNGFFALLMQLSGYAGGQGEYTAAALRDMASAHINGLLWVDDVASASNIWDIMRQATGGGSRTKKGQDNTEQETVKMVAPIALSGEGFKELRREKALWDRAVVISVQSPTGRKSLKDPSRPQWDDIVDLVNANGRDLTQHAGTITQIALQHSSLAQDVRKYRAGSGRFADKNAILRVGARMLAELSEQEEWIGRVDEWVERQEDTEQDNMLTRQLLPSALIYYSYPMRPMPDCPVFIEDGIVYFNEPMLAEWWSQGRRSERELQLGSRESIKQQRRALGAEGKGKVVGLYIDDKRRQFRFQNLSAEHSAEVLDRAGMSLGVSQPVTVSLEDKSGWLSE